MTRELFYERLMKFNNYISQKYWGKIALLIDNALYCETNSTLPSISYVEGLYLLKNFISKAHPLHACIISCTKRRYKREILPYALYRVFIKCVTYLVALWQPNLQFNFSDYLHHL